MHIINFLHYFSTYDIEREVLPELTTGTAIGISVAIAGNVVISLALNLQKLAHKRLEAEQTPASSVKSQLPGSAGSENPRPVSTVDEAEEIGSTQASDAETGPIEQSVDERASYTRASESEPLLPFPEAHHYGSSQSSPQKRKLITRLFPFRSHQKPKSRPTPILLPVDIIPGSRFIRNSDTSKPANTESTEETALDDIEAGNESNYLKSKLWWTGFLLMNVGEMGNFISYAWAPASIVAPLGTFALVANCLFSPLILGERFRKRDIFGILIAIIGAITVVLSSNASDSRLDPRGLVRAISQTPFIVYSCIYVVGAIILASLSRSSYGRRYALVDIGLCALFGGFTVLSTKAVSTLLTMRWSRVFTSVITYPVIVVLILTGVGQIRYLNRALMRFDSKIVIPIQFVLFNLSAIIGSAILYGDFKRASFHQIVTFLYGCAATFAGVFILAWSSQTSDNDDRKQTENIPNAIDGAASDRAEQVASNLSLGSLGRRRKATLILPDLTGDIPALHHKHSAISVMGLSPAQPLLLVHTPPREHPMMRDPERDISTPSSYQRRRTMSWFGDDSPRAVVHDGGRRTRDSSVAGRLRSTAGASGINQNSSPHPP
ncbi:magnesium transporter NIPA-domain-containing protein [Rhodocollybia butyracea]|uniref:Magnesium transporter NIPA-domain-containing protein n=1 Tax=Rhodocollybia butyracea TaxID=206335 RepID=A0A9P5Q114_9AGAR|nr:magnesium transporter NIPA-domain-containing protein [Rhodocollybia butyracea]